PTAVLCNCSVDRVHRPCNSVDEKLARAPMVPTPSSFSSEYLDAHSIRLQIPPHPGAFAYIFEYATVSTRSDEWYFAIPPHPGAFAYVFEYATVSTRSDEWYFA
ncbi:hypothetical protein GCK32_020061, partial [Trichostrongylus colubriformis]